MLRNCTVAMHRPSGWQSNWCCMHNIKGFLLLCTGTWLSENCTDYLLEQTRIKFPAYAFRETHVASSPLLYVLQILCFEKPTFQGFKWYIERTSVHGFKWYIERISVHGFKLIFGRISSSKFYFRKT